MTTIDIDALLNEASLPERTIQICLRGDLYSRHEILTRERDELKASDGLGESDATAALREQITEVEAAMKAATVTFKLRGLAKPVADRIILDNPAREGVEIDQRAGYNIEAVEVATIRACVVEPELNDERWAKFSKVLTPAQWRTLMSACDALNYTALDLPF